MTENKTSQLQIRVSPAQKRAIKQEARAAGLDVSAWVLRRLTPPKRARFLELASELSRAHQVSFTLAAISDFLGGLSRAEIVTVLDQAPRDAIPQPWLNYVAAMIEERADAIGTPVPAWVRDVSPLREPYFATGLASLRLYLLTRSPPAFRRRNLFVDRGPGRV